MQKCTTSLQRSLWMEQFLQQIDLHALYVGTELMCVSCVPTVDSVFSVEVGGNETQFTLRELQPNQAYRLRIAAGTGVGFGVPSEWAQHQTLAHYNHSDHSIGKEDTRPGSLSICSFLKSLFCSAQGLWVSHWSCRVIFANTWNFSNYNPYKENDII